MGGARVVPVAKVNRAVGTHRHVAGRKPGVVRLEQIALVDCRERRTAPLESMPVDSVAQKVGADVLSAERFAQ